MDSASLARRGRRRAGIAAVVLIAWVAGLAALGRRELFVGDAQRLAEAALTVSPGATYYVVEQGGQQIGFASTTLDTTATGFDVIDDFVADLSVGGTTTQASARSDVKLSRGLALRSFEVKVEAPGGRILAGGRADGDSGVVYSLSANGAPSDSQRLAVRGPILLPTLVPLAVALGGTPKVGKTLSFPTLDPNTMTQRPVNLVVRAESVFTVVDSARYDSTRVEWVSALTDTIRAWRIEPAEAGNGFSGWIDAQGRVVQSSQAGGITIRRMAFEIAFENWRNARERRAGVGGTANDIIERTAIGANAALARAQFTQLRVRLRGVDLRGYQLAGGRQQLAGDTLSIARETGAALTPEYSFERARPEAFKERFKRELGDEPFLQAHSVPIVTQAIRIAGLERNPRVIAEKLMLWVHDSLKKEVVFSVPNALDVLRTRKGDCNEHTQLYVAFARAIGIPARIATGLAYVRGKFYFHAWPEVFLGEWVAVDPTFGQFPADAAHLRFAVGGVMQQTELIRLVGNLKIDVVEAK